MSAEEQTGLGKSGHANIDEAMVAVWGEITDVVTREGRTGEQGGRVYDYINIDDLMKQAHAVLQRHGVYAYGFHFEVLHQDHVPTRDGKGQLHHLQIMETVRFVHAPSGSDIFALGLGEALDASNKASAIAASGAAKVAFLHALGLAKGDDDPDHAPGQEMGLASAAASAAERHGPSTGQPAWWPSYVAKVKEHALSRALLAKVIECNLDAVDQPTVVGPKIAQKGGWEKVISTAVDLREAAR